MRLTQLKSYRLPFLILLAAAAVFVLLLSTSEKPVPLQTTTRAPTVSIQIIEKTTASSTLRIFGEVETPTMSVLTAGLEADILEVNVLEGDAVKNDQVLIVLDDEDTALEILQRRAELQEIKAQIASEKITLQADKDSLKTEKSLLALSNKAVQRASQLAKSSAGTVAAVDIALQNEQRQQLAVTARQQKIDNFASRQQQLKARHGKASANLKRARREQQRTKVTAPFNGRITEVMVAVGERATRQTQLLRIHDESRLELRAQVPAGSLPLLRQAMAASQVVTATAIVAGKSLSRSGTESESESDFQRQSNFHSVELELHRLSANVIAGQGGRDAFFRAASGEQLPVLGETVEINLQLPPIKNVVVISADSLYGNSQVYRVVEGRLASIPVRRVGQFSNAQGQPMLMLDGTDFKNGEQILTSRLPQAVSGMQVEVLP